MPTSDDPTRLADILREQLDDPRRIWLDRARAIAATGTQHQLLVEYAAASHRIGDGPLRFPGPPASTTFLQWTLEDAARATLVLARSGHPDFVADASACYEQGDAREQQSWLRAVAMLPAPERFLPLAIDACRSSILPVFEAIACENPYPSLCFPELNFNQLVLKALFNGVAVARIIGLRGRLNQELSRMATDYASERRAAGRPVPPDISHVITDAPGEPTR